MLAGQDFFNAYNHDFARAAVCVPRLRVADPAFNAAQTIELMEQAVGERAVVALLQWCARKWREQRYLRL